MKLAAAVVAILGFYAFFYPFVLRRFGAPARALIAPLRLEARHPARDVDAVGKLAAAGVAQLLFAVVLMAALGIDPGEIVGIDVGLVVLGLLLGVGELALAGFLCTVVVHLAGTLSRETSGDEWVARARSGWMRYFVATARAAPPWFAAAAISLYVVVEEIVFRGIVISAASPHGKAAACFVSVILFVAVQAFGMPSVRAALFPLVGAAVVGPIHALLFWQVQDVLPLAAAHLAYFGAALVVATRSGADAAAVRVA